MLASVVYRLATRRTMFASSHPQATYVERWASGRSGTGLMGRLSTAKNCLQVQVLSGRLVVSPHFPMTLGFAPEIYDLDKDIATSCITSATILGGNAVQVVEIQFRTAQGKPAVLQLLLRRAPQFLASLNESKSPP